MHAATYSFTLFYYRTNWTHKTIHSSSHFLNITLSALVCINMYAFSFWLFINKAKSIFKLKYCHQFHTLERRKRGSVQFKKLKSLWISEIELLTMLKWEIMMHDNFILFQYQMLIETVVFHFNWFNVIIYILNVSHTPSQYT